MTVLVAVQTAAVALAVNYGVHLGSSVGYSQFCVPESFWDIPRSFITTASPVCTFLLNTMQLTQNNVAVVLTTTLAAVVAGALKP